MSPMPLVNFAPEGQKKALFIAICYKETSEGPPTLDVSQGLWSLKDLILNEYGYDEEDIVVMSDDPEHQLDPWLRPTRSNILSQIDALIEGAKSGDQFFFHYSGHSEQRENRRKTEEDGFDEVMISCDGQDIIDNELKQRLVDPLPVGSKLVAILDTCHSESMLDLKHNKCNRIFTPRINKGPRRTKTMWDGTVRRDAMLVTSERTWSQHYHGPEDGFGFCEASSRTTSIDTVTRSPRPGPVENQSGSFFAEPTPSIGSVINTESDSEHRTSMMPICHQIDTSVPEDSIIIPERQRCTSPIPLWECQGNCHQTSTPFPEAAHVICVSACKDAQLTWDGQGKSLTMEIVNILTANPHPSLKELMTSLTERTHKRCLEIHQQTRMYKKRGYYVPGEMSEFQDPQVASHKPLNMDELFMQ